ncbi:MAG: SDR family NAD(P)-dependent oxidoreductase [Gemmatimonadaceae bacterium]|nr:SDR family NAD(P)-dependent oxidoreductase [Gemmatimonadaceae bacterium]
MSASAQTWFITGSSRGLGRAIAEAALAAGHRVVATARNPRQLADLEASYGDRVRAIALDVTNPGQARAAVAEAVEAFDRIDVLVNNAGYGYFGGVEELTDDAIRAQIDTNVYGVVHVTRAVLPIMRRQRSGHIMQISSIGGRAATPGLGAYHLSKFAIEGFSESLASEVAPLGIRVTIVEPGGFRTDWAGSSMEHATPIDDYAPTVGAMRAVLNSAATPMGDPAKAAAALLSIAGRLDAPLRLPLGSDAALMLRGSYAANLAEVDRWAHVSRATDADDVTSEQLAALERMVKGLGAGASDAPLDVAAQS